jgi:hypothetical protein
MKLCKPPFQSQLFHSKRQAKASGQEKSDDHEIAYPSEKNGQLAQAQRSHEYFLPGFDNPI